MSSRARAAFLVGAAVSISGLSAGCIERGYPLGSSGGVEVRLDTAGSLFAADVLGADGKGALPRQTPFSSGVTLTLTDGNQAANGAIVEVRVEPAEALTLTPDEKEDSAVRTCKAKDGKFRCAASVEGIARFVVASPANWSGQAKLVVTWADQRKETLIDVLPAGLPTTAKDFQIVASGLADSNRVLPSFTALSCTTIDALPSDLGSKWRPGNVRSRQAFVRASAPFDQPGVVANAPVIIESLDSEAALSLTAACDTETRVTRLRVLLGDTGESPPFYLCFSDIGGNIELAVSSGSFAITPNPSLRVDAEPRVLRVQALAPSVKQGEVGSLFEVTAFNTDLQRIAMPVDLEASDPSILQLSTASVTLSPEGADPTAILVSPVAPGSASLHVRPRLFKQPDCESLPIIVTEAP